MKESVSIATKPLVYQVFRHVENKVQYALAEYIDNSISSFEHHKDVLSKINPNGKVRVNVDFSEDCIRITDNAFGIEKENYQRAFELAQVPLDVKGLNEFGMGMKVSSIWLSDHWVVESTAYGENLKKTFEFDLQDVIDGEKTDLDVEEEYVDVNTHYTRITLTQLSSNKPTSRQIGFVKNHLCSIYSQFIRNGILDLYINGELQKYQAPKILKAPYYKNKNNNEEIEWIYPFDYTFGNQKAKGFVAVLEKQSTAEQNGFLLFRRGRTIGTSSDDKYRPKALCGHVGSPQYKRIFGEIEIEGFEVSFTKSSFTEDDQFQTFIEELAKEIKHESTIDIFGQAEHYRKEDDPKKAEEKAVNAMAKKLTQPVNIVTTPPPVSKTEHVTTHSVSDTANSKQLTLFEIPESNLLQKPIKKQMSIDGKNFCVEIRFVKNSGGLYFYSVESSGSSNYFVVNLYMDNPYFSCYNELLKDEESAGPMLHIIQSLVATEIKMISKGLSSPAKTYRDILNNIIGKF